MANLYATYTQFTNRVDVGSTPTAAEESVVMDALEDASRMLDRATFRRFYPSIETRVFDFDEQYLLRLDEDLLSVTTFTTDNGDTTVTAGFIYLLAGDSYNIQPYTRIRLKRDESDYLGFNTTPQRSQSVTGVWGYHEDYDNAFASSGAVIAEGGTFSASDTTLTVDDGTAFERGQTIQIDSEWLYISDISTNDLTVERGVNGSTAATHADATAISIYKPIRDVQRACLRLAMWFYAEEESALSYELQTAEDGSIIIPPAAPPAVHSFVKAYRRVRD